MNYLLLILLLIFSGCQEAYKSPLGPELTESDFKVLTSVPEGKACSPSISKSSFSLPKPYQERISLHLTPEISVNSALKRVTQTLGIDLQLDSDVTDVCVNFSATQRPFVEILENICSLAKWRYRICHQVLFIEMDKPYRKNYNVQFLNINRSSQNSLSSITDLLTDSVKYDEKGVPIVINHDLNGSNTSIKMNGENDFWNEIEINLKTILDSNVNSNVDPDKPHPSFSIHKQAGIISVYGTSQQQYYVNQYLDMLQKSASSQILIEAKIIEVRLHEKFKNGIEWGRLETDTEDSFIFGANYTDKKSLQNVSLKKGFFQATASLNNGMYGLVKCLNHFGTTRTLSSPRLTVMNNQIALLKVARNHVYFKVNFNRYYHGKKTDRPDIGVGSNIQTVPIGLVMSVQPAIDPIKKSVILFLRPTISRLVDTVSDPSLPVAYALIEQMPKKMPESKVPVIEVKEVDSVLRLNDGEVAILGGLMETQSIGQKNGAPVLGHVPTVRNLFSSSKKDDKVTEIVILIRVKILDSVIPDKADERLMHLYTVDSRPFF